MRLADHLAELPRDDRPAAPGYGGYRELVARWAAVERSGARARCIGFTIEAAPLYALELGPADAPRASIILGGVHPMEWIGVEVATALVEQLAASPPDDRRVLAIPLVNADGFRRVERDLRAGRRRFRRTNRRGVDLNRNWPTHFRKPPRVRALGWNQPGRHAASEPEIAACLGALDEVAERAVIERALSLHSIGRMILYPFGGRWRPPAEVGALRAAARAVRDRLPRRYRVRQSSHWVPGLYAYGMEIDHLHARYGALALLVECSLGGASARAPSSVLHPFRIFNPPEPEPEAAELVRALAPFVRGA